MHRGTESYKVITRTLPCKSCSVPTKFTIEIGRQGRNSVAMICQTCIDKRANEQKELRGDYPKYAKNRGKPKL